ncbi:MAG: PAS domain S-box protein [Chloroflexi bacterium]|nr:PAS domain S-box protein [Chloroflexota bacterium]
MSSLKILKNQHFWYIAIIFCATSILQYSTILFFLDVPVVFYRAWFTSYTIENILFLIPIIYANYIFRLRGGIVSLVLSSIVMLPKSIFQSPDLVSALLVSSGVIVTGSVITLSFYLYYRNISQWGYARDMLSKLIDALPVPIFAINRSHQVTQWNTAIEELTGTRREDMLGTGDYWKAFYSEKRSVMADLITDGASEDDTESNYPGICRKSPLIKGAYEAENFFPALKPDGKWLYFTASPIIGFHNDIVGAAETLSDITDRKNAEKALKESEKSYRDLFESALDAIWVHDVQGNIIAVNEATARLTGYSREELLGFNVKTFLTEENLKLAREVKTNLIQHQPMAMPYEQTLLKKDRTVAVCMITTNLIMGNDGPAAFQNIARDVTEEKRLYDNMRYYLEQITMAQEEERKRIARELHDSTLQTLIALLHQMEYQLNKTNLPIKDAKALWEFHEQLREVVYEVRRFSRDLRPSILDDLGLLPALEWLTQELKNNYAIESTLEISGEQRRLLPEAELLLFRIVQEALNNVAKHAQATSAEVKIQFTENKVRVDVIDNGKGFVVPEKPDDLPRLGKLGLAGLQERAQLLGGSLKLLSEPGKGSTVTVEAFA